MERCPFFTMNPTFAFGQRIRPGERFAPLRFPLESPSKVAQSQFPDKTGIFEASIYCRFKIYTNKIKAVLANNVMYCFGLYQLSI